MSLLQCLCSVKDGFLVKQLPQSQPFFEDRHSTLYFCYANLHRLSYINPILNNLFSSLVSSEIRAQLVEQQKCLDQQTEMRVQLLQDLQDFFRKKAEIEMEYSRNLEKLAERFMAKTRSTKDHQQYKWGDAVLMFVCAQFVIWVHLWAWKYFISNNQSEHCHSYLV